MKESFIAAICAKKKVLLTFHSKEDQGTLVRTCAPMDYGPKRKAHDQSDRFHLWDYDSDKKMHTLGLLPSQVIKMEVLDKTFDPAEFITWDVKTSPWHVPRDWGQYS